MSFIEERKALTREKRLSTLSHYNGNLEQLSNDVKGTEIKQRIRTFSQCSNDEILFAFRALSKIEQSAIIVHGSLGCSASGIQWNQEKNLHWYSTNLNERDTILGGDEKLRKAVFRAYEEQKPKVIFIIGTPVVAINNDDVNAVIYELEDELDVKIISIYTDGFKSKSPVTGYDIVLHSLLRYIVDRTPKPEGKKENFINVVTLSENRADVVAVIKILKELEIPYQLLPQFSTIEEIERAGNARATITLNSDEGAYFAEELEEVFGVPYIRTQVPIGIRGTRKFIKKLAKALEIEKKAEEYIEKEEEEAQKVIGRTPLAGKTVFLDIDLAAAQGFIELVESLGGKTAGLAVTDVDLNNRDIIDRLDSLTNVTPAVVANGQPFEKANILSKDKIDYYVGLEENVAFAAEQGSIPISLAHTAIHGFEGIKQFVGLIEKAEAAKEFRAYAIEKEAFYKAAWLKKSSNWYVKQEVK